MVVGKGMISTHLKIMWLQDTQDRSKVTLTVLPGAIIGIKRHTAVTAAVAKAYNQSNPLRRTPKAVLNKQWLIQSQSLFNRPVSKLTLFPHLNLKSLGKTVKG